MASAARPGQFVMLRVPQRLDPLLPRPMSVSEVLLGEKGHPERIRILHKVVGRGTALLSGLAPGDRLQVLGPLGEPFRVPPAQGPGARAVMIAGGIGVAVFPFLVPALRAAGWTPILLLGARGKADLVRRDWFGRAQVEVRTATEDGSEGAHGRVTTLLDDTLSSPSGSEMLYVCGPRPMLQAVAERANARGLPCQLSLEAFMGCGFGVCLGCVAKVRRGDDFAYARVCVEGPTFMATEVLWE